MDLNAVVWEKIGDSVAPFYDNDIFGILKGFGKIFEHEAKIL